AHHLGRPDPLPHRERGRGLAGQGPDQADARVPDQAEAGRRGVLHRGRPGGRHRGGEPARAGAVAARPGAAAAVRQRVPQRLPAAGHPARRLHPLPRLVRRRAALMATSSTETLTIGKAINLGLRRAMENDPKVVLMGEDIGNLGGVFRITDGLQKDFGEQRVIDTPLAEAGIVGTAVGLAIRGYRPVCEIQFDGFVYLAYNQIVSQVAKMHYRSHGNVRLPMVVRIPYGGGIGAVEHHSESPEAYFAHTAGLKVVTCANGQDAYWMIQQAIESDDPIILLEPKRRYWEKGLVDPGSASLPLHASQVVQPGTDATVVAYGPMVRTALDAASAAQEDGRS